MKTYGLLGPCHRCSPVLSTVRPYNSEQSGTCQAIPLRKAKERGTRTLCSGSLARPEPSAISDISRNDRTPIKGEVNRSEG